MDITGGYSKPTYFQKARRIYARLTLKGKIVFGIIGLLFLYLILPSWSTISSDYDPNDNQSSSLPSHGTTISRSQLNTLSDLLNYSPKVNPITLSYLSLPPFLNSQNIFPHYKNGGNMLLSRTAEYVRLVQDAPKQSGNLFSHVAISTDDLSAIEVEVEFKLFGNQEKTNLIGDGMAIWLTTEQLNQGDVFGMQDKFNGLGLFIDTYKNDNSKKNRHAFPYLSIQRNRGQENFYHKNTDGIDTQLGGCSLSRIYNNEAKSSKIRMTYVRNANVFEIDVDIEGNNNWKTCFRKENLLADDILPIGRQLYFGVSAETGELHHNVDLYSINVKSFRDKNGNLINEIDSLAEGLNIINDDNSKNEQEISNTNVNEDTISRRRSQRKTMNRLRRQEKKLKELDRQKYNSEHGFVGWFFGLVWKVIKLIFYVLLILVVMYATVIGFRVYKEKQRKKNIGGLL